MAGAAIPARPARDGGNPRRRERYLYAIRIEPREAQKEWKHHARVMEERGR